MPSGSCVVQVRDVHVSFLEPGAHAHFPRTYEAHWYHVHSISQVDGDHKAVRITSGVIV